MDTKTDKDDDPRVLISQAGQAWSDVRTYTGNIWQVAAVFLTAIFLGVNVTMSAYATNDVPLLLYSLILGFVSIFSFLAFYTITWLRSNIVERVTFIHQTERVLLSLKKSLEPTKDIFGLGDGPLKALLLLFGIAFGVAFSGFALTGAISITILLLLYQPVIITLIAMPILLVLMGILGVYLGRYSVSMYNDLRKDELEAKEAGEQIEFEYEVMDKLDGIAPARFYLVLSSTISGSPSGIHRKLSLDGREATVLTKRGKKYTKEHEIKKLIEGITNLQTSDYSYRYVLIVIEGAKVYLVKTPEDFIPIKNSSDITTNKDASILVFGLEADQRHIVDWLQSRS